MKQALCVLLMMAGLSGAPAKEFTLVKHAHNIQIVGRGIKISIDYADNDPEAVDVFAQGVADYLNSLGDNPEFPEAK